MNAMRRAAGLAAAVVAGCGLIAAAPAAAHATAPAAVHAITGTGARPADGEANRCSGNVDLHLFNGNDLCLPGGYAHPVHLTPVQCGVDWINTGGSWADWYWALPGYPFQREDGQPPWSTWSDGHEPVCVSTVDIDT